MTCGLDGADDYVSILVIDIERRDILIIGIVNDQILPSSESFAEIFQT